MKTIAICHLKGRVAPRYDNTNEFLVVTVNERNDIVAEKIFTVAAVKPAEFADELHRLKVNVLICGGVQEDWQTVLRRNDILLIDNVIGNIDDILERYLQNQLRRGEVVS